MNLFPQHSLYRRDFCFRNCASHMPRTPKKPTTPLVCNTGIRPDTSGCDLDEHVARETAEGRPSCGDRSIGARSGTAAETFHRFLLQIRGYPLFVPATGLEWRTSRSTTTGAVVVATVIRWPIAGCDYQLYLKWTKLRHFSVPCATLKTCPRVVAEQALPDMDSPVCQTTKLQFLEATSRRCAYGTSPTMPLQAVIQLIGNRKRALVQHRTQHTNPFGAQPFRHSQSQLRAAWNWPPAP